MDDIAPFRLQHLGAGGHFHGIKRAEAEWRVFVHLHFSIGAIVSPKLKDGLAQQELMRPMRRRLRFGAICPI
jgi:hypothetical protein